MGKQNFDNSGPSLGDILGPAFKRQIERESFEGATKLTPDPMPDNPASPVRFVKAIRDAVEARMPQLQMNLAEAKRLAEYLESALARDENGNLYLKK